MLFLSKLHILPAYALPLLSFCLAFINISLYFGESIEVKSHMANTLNLFQSLIVPLFVLVLFELTFRLHEARSAKVHTHKNHTECTNCILASMYACSYFSNIESFIDLYVYLFCFYFFEQFCYIPFDQQADVVNDWGFSIKMVTRVPLWFVRVIVGGLFAINILVYYR